MARDDVAEDDGTSMSMRRRGAVRWEVNLEYDYGFLRAVGDGILVEREDIWEWTAG